MPPIVKKGKTIVDETTPETRLYLGIDPGMSGGIALISGSKTVYHLCSLKGLNCSGILKELNTVCQIWSSILHLTVIMEEVIGYQGKGEGEKGGGAANGTAMFKFGASYGRLQMALSAKHISWKEVSPRIWQKEFITLGNTEKSTHKRLLKIKAKELFKDTKGITLHTADSLLLAEYIRRKGENKYATNSR